MTHLEQKIFMAIGEQAFYTKVDMARIAASIALELAEKAYYEGRYAGREDVYYNYQFGDSKTFNQFIQDYE